MLFVGSGGGLQTDYPPVRGLWVTDGTAAGTHELATGSQFYGGLDPSDLTMFNGEVLFAGADGASEYGLWVTNGTAAGTTEIGGFDDAGISGANTQFGLEPSDLTDFNGEALFSGVDAAGHQGLWETNGTAAGTFEFTGIIGANSDGLFYGINPDFTVSNGEVLFTGMDDAGHEGLWVTNGTASGTLELTSAPPATYDFPGNGISDVLFQNSSNGEAYDMADERHHRHEQRLCRQQHQSELASRHRRRRL